jgi:protease-4
MEGGGLMSDGGISAKAYTKIFRKLRKDDAVKAVVLRIDSPGGSALASDLLWHELMLLKKEKPLVASVGGMAASGGYYMACAANKIVAPETSIVGSIGVFGGKIVLAGTLDKVGINALTFPASKEEGAAARAAYLSPLVPWDDATRQRVREQMQSVYDLFIRRVSEGRGRLGAEIRKIAEGRIYTGGQGLDVGLVDEIGGLDHALSVARKLGELGPDAPVTVVGPQETLLDLLKLGEGASASEVEAAVLRLQARHDQVLGRVRASLQPFLASLAPLAAGEVAVAALPYGLAIE